MLSGPPAVSSLVTSTVLEFLAGVFVDLVTVNSPEKHLPSTASYVYFLVHLVSWKA